LSLALPVHVAAEEGIEGKTITLVADSWCPYNCEDSSPNPGFMVEIAAYAFARAGYQIEYINVPWIRALHGAKSGVYDAIVGVDKQESLGLVLPEFPLAEARYTFYVRESSNWQYQGIESLSQVTLGVLRGYAYGDLRRDYITPNAGNSRLIQSISNDGGLAQNIKKVLSGRIDVLVEDQSVIQSYVHQHPQATGLRKAGVAHTEALYIGFSKRNPLAQEFAQIMDDGLSDLKSRKQLSKILVKYGLAPLADK